MLDRLRVYRHRRGRPLRVPQGDTTLSHRICLVKGPEYDRVAGDRWREKDGDTGAWEMHFHPFFAVYIAVSVQVLFETEQKRCVMKCTTVFRVCTRCDESIRLRINVRVAQRARGYPTYHDWEGLMSHNCLAVCLDIPSSFVH